MNVEGIYTSYSQNKEDLIVLDLVKGMTGMVLSIGEFDGKTNSNSLALIERGWKAVLVEPSPWAFDKLMALHGGNPNVSLVNVAIGTERRMVRFYECPGKQVSTTRQDQLERWKASGWTWRDYFVSQITVADLMNECGASADVLSIDAEGVSVDILMQCPISAWGTRVVIIEHDRKAEAISAWMRDRGFRICELNGENAIFAKVQQ